MALLEFIVLASTYCDARIASGARMDCSKHTAASRELPIGSCISIKDVVIKINDLGPCTSSWCKRTRPDLLKRKLDLSHGAAKAIKFNGLGKVKFKIVDCN